MTFRKSFLPRIFSSKEKTISQTDEDSFDSSVAESESTSRLGSLNFSNLQSQMSDISDRRDFRFSNLDFLCCALFLILVWELICTPTMIDLLELYLCRPWHAFRKSPTDIAEKRNLAGFSEFDECVPMVDKAMDSS
ncbi:uncharacterized protein LOC131255000 [Magnolia sinica]|uniref:uncharacterized protein LOC131255000 n=1 Tax=Magnolia sinica TaxID=86752 RepID=UPI002658EFE4|nr:uncharacterized protein LOC131255000 [Magnolia sinica]